MTKFMINNRTDARKTDVELLIGCKSTSKVEMKIAEVDTRAQKLEVKITPNACKY